LKGWVDLLGNNAVTAENLFGACPPGPEFRLNTQATLGPVLSTRLLTKRYGSLTAVEDLDLEISAGELFGFLGPNGAGKTTTIKMLVGLLRPTSGTARVAGIDIMAEPEKAKARIGYVPDAATLYDKLSGREFLEFSGDLYHVDVVGARAAGLHAVLLDIAGLYDGYDCPRIRTFSELPA